MSQEQVDAISVHNDKEIKGFFGKYRFLSNFHRANVQIDGVWYPSTENAYMAAKCVNETDKIPFLTAEPKDAKTLGRKVQLRPDWEEVKFDIMYQVNLDKFTRHPELKQALLDTGDAYLEETNWWNDTIWGVCNEIGENNLGKILMLIRDELRAGHNKVLQAVAEGN